MSVAIQIPSALRSCCHGASEIVLSASCVREALEQLEQNQTSLYQSVCDETGAVRRHVNLFVNGVLLSHSDGLETPLGPGDVLTIMPAVSGG